MAISHFAVGVSFAVVALHITGYQNHTLRTIPMFVFGVMAFLPDIHHIFGSTNLSSTVVEFHSSVYANVFFMHHIMDTIDKTDSKAFAAICLMGMFTSLCVLWWNDVKREL